MTRDCAKVWRSRDSKSTARSEQTRLAGSLLPDLRRRGHRSFDLRRLCGRYLPALWYAPRIAGRTRDRDNYIMDSSSVVSPPSTKESQTAQPSLVRGLSLLDSVLLLVSGVIGSSIFLTAKDIAGPLPNPVLFLGVWIAGAVISLLRLCGLR